MKQQTPHRRPRPNASHHESRLNPHDAKQADVTRIVLLITTLADQQLVQQCCDHAARFGVTPDMTLAHARAILPCCPSGKSVPPNTKRDTTRRTKHTTQRQPKRNLKKAPPAIYALHVEPYDLQADLTALEHFAKWALRFCPVVTSNPSPWSSTSAINTQHTPLHMPGLLMDITGCDRLYRSEHNLITQLAKAVTAMHITCRISTAPTFGAAWALARFGDEARTIVTREQLSDAIAPLPLQALRLEREVIEHLAEVGIERVGQVMNMPRRALPARFGDDLLLRMDQALGHAFETITPTRPVPPPCTELFFQGPSTNTQTIETAARQLLSQLITELHHREVGVRNLTLHLHHVVLDKRVGTGLPASAHANITLKFSQPTRGFKHIWSLLYPKLEKAHLGHGVEGMTLTAAHVGRLRHEQTQVAHWRDDDRATRAEIEHAFGEMLDVLDNRLGSQRIQRVELIGAHQPEQAFRFHPASHSHLTQDFNFDSFAKQHKREHADEQAMVFDWFNCDRPSVLFARPEPMNAIAVTPDGAPTLLHWRQQTHRVTASIGPLRIAAPWWQSREGEGSGKNKAPTRDFF